MNARSFDPDYEILKHFEPVVYYTQGEQFFPIAVERYVSQCSLWQKNLDEPAEQIIPQGQLSIEDLQKPYEANRGTIHYLKFIEPLDLVELAKYSINQAVSSISHHDSTDIFRRGLGRLARVGYGSRLIDALFSLTLIFRGRVPGDTSAAAALAYNQMQAENPTYTCYGRVVRENGWIILQYWYFYPFNNWRSGFFGVNDHEGDWETVSIYCSESPGNDHSGENIIPEWVAYAAHDFSGDDLRRHWLDPEVKKIDTHPVIFAGAGSHASYFAKGEYLSEIELPGLSILVNLVEKLKLIWINTLKQAGFRTTENTFNVFRIPFVDYARGDGLSIGFDQPQEWDLCPIDENTPWAMNYRGLWGLYAQDPISGENAPAGPVYNRDGSVRRCWYDPLGWVGLDKVPPSHLALSVLNEQREKILNENDELIELIDKKSRELYRLGVEVTACQAHNYMHQHFQMLSDQVASLSTEIGELRCEYADNQAKLEALSCYQDKLKQGEVCSLRDHIRREQKPSATIDTRLNRFTEFLAAGSIGFLMIGIVGIVLFARHYLFIGLAIMIGFLLFMEASFRRQLPRLISNLTVGLAIVSALVIIYEFFWQIIVLGVLAAGLFIIWENLREIRL